MTSIRTLVAALWLGQLLVMPARAMDKSSMLAAAWPQSCTALPSQVRHAMRVMSFCLSAPQWTGECGRMGVDAQIVADHRGLLPGAPQGQQYWQGGLRRGKGAAEPGRLVYLVSMGTIRNVVLQRYYTADRYATACQIL